MNRKWSQRLDLTRARRGVIGVLASIVLALSVPAAQASLAFGASSPQAIWQAARHQAHAVDEGHGRHALFVFVDPNCPFCHTLFEQLQPLIGPHDLTVHWVVVGILRATSAGKAAAILGARDPLAALMRSEKGFRRGGGGGAIRPVPVRGSAAAALAANDHVLAMTGPELVPTLVYRNAAGQVIVHQGVPLEPHGLLWTVDAIR